MKPLFLILSFFVPISAQIIFTEIMYDLPGTDSPNEFVEIFNSSEIDSVHLAGWTIVDRSSSDVLVDSGFGLSIPPLAYALILEGDYNFSSGAYLDIIPTETILIKVDDSSIGNGLSNSDSLFLYDSSGVLIDSLGWTDVSPDGFSLERVRLHFPNESFNWIPSLDSLGTPGVINSVYPENIDGALVESSLSLSPAIIENGGTSTIIGRVVNEGLENFEGQIQISDNLNIISTEFLEILSELDTTSFEMEIGPFGFGEHGLSVSLLITDDSNLINNIDSINLGVRYETQLFRINEFYPKPTSEEPEFIEFIYFGEDSININNWELKDSRDNTNYRFPEKMIGPNEYFIVADDSSFLTLVPDSVPYIVPIGGFPSLNNSDDNIRLLDPFGTVIDSLSYDADFGYTTGKSTEKIFMDSLSHLSNNWRQSSAEIGKTPGYLNAVTPFEIDGTLISGLVFNPLYPEENQPFSVMVSVLNSGILPFLGALTISHFDDDLSEMSFNSGALGDTTFVEMNLPGFTSGSHQLTIDLFLPGDDNLDDNSWVDTLKVQYRFKTVVLNEFMALPNNDQSEFVEFIVSQDLNMKDWQFSDNQKSPVPIPDRMVYENNFVVLLSDSVMLNAVNPNAHIFVYEEGFPSLNNSGDAIYIYDMTGAIIDSLIYDQTWDIASEFSTEKLRAEFESNLKSNWIIAESENGHSAGEQNSQMLKDIDGALIQSLLSHSPQFPERSDSTRINIWIKNNGVQPFSGNVFIENDDDELGESSFSTISPGDTLMLQITVPPMSSGIHFLQIFLDVLDDTYWGNDGITDTILVSFPFGALKINEFLSLRDSNYFEFVELVSDTNLNILGWGLSDISGKVMTFPNLNLNKGDYFILSGDSAFLDLMTDIDAVQISETNFPNLNNGTDGIYVLDMTGKILDSLIYDESWPIIENRSTEKFHISYPSNSSKSWGVAVNESGMTPGAKNSLAFETLPEDGSINFSPNPFSPDGDGYDDILNMEYDLPFENSTLRIEIFDMTGRKIAEPFYNLNVGQNGVLTWDGLRSTEQRARIGIYLIKTTARDHATGKIWEDLQTIILAKKL